MTPTDELTQLTTTQAPTTTLGEPPPDVQCPVELTQADYNRLFDDPLVAAGNQRWRELTKVIDADPVVAAGHQRENELLDQAADDPVVAAGSQRYGELTDQAQDDPVVAAGHQRWLKLAEPADADPVVAAANRRANELRAELVARHRSHAGRPHQPGDSCDKETRT
jgi:hypothetical protein